MAGKARPGMTPSDIGSLRSADDPQVSPDGRLVAFVVSDVDLEHNRTRRRIYLAETESDVAPLPFTDGPGDALARWSPDGAFLAFVSKGPDGPAEICVLPVGRGGARVVVATLAEPPSALAWSPDGTRLGFVARDPDPEHYGEPGQEKKPKDVPSRRVTRFFSRLNGEGFVFDRPRRVWVVPADGASAPFRLTAGPHEADDVAWSPDGATVAFASARHDTWDLDGAVDLFTVSSDGSGEPVLLTETVSAYSSPTWSPDGTRLAYLVEPTPLEGPRHVRLGVLTLADLSCRDLSGDLDRNCRPYGASRAPVWAGDRLLCQVEDSGNVHVYAFAAGGGSPPAPMVAGTRWVSGFDVAGGTLAFVASTPVHPSELVVRGIEPAGDEAERRRSDLSASLIARLRLSEPETYAASSADGTEVPCWAMPPVGAKPGHRYPTLLNVHGGPFTSYGNRFFDEFHIESGAGFGVLYCNPRGSSGYSEAWGRAVRWPGCAVDPGSGWGGVDFEDVMVCAEEGARRFAWVDPDRLGILGGSYGGYMTSWAIGHTDRFKAACSERAVNDLLALEQSSDAASAFRSYIGCTFLEDPDAYRSRSPIASVEAMTTPVLILHSEEDLRCPMNQAEELFVALRLLGREPVLIRFPGENHDLSRSGAPRHRVERAEIILDWFRERLGD